MYPHLKERLNRTNGLVFMAQTLSGSFHSEKRKFWRIYNLNPPKLPKPPLLLVKTNTWNLGHKNQTVCPIKTPFEIWIHFCEAVSMTPKKIKIILADFLLFLINFQTKKSTHLQNDFFQKAVSIHSKFLGKKLSFDTNIDFLKSNPMGNFFYPRQV